MCAVHHTTCQRLVATLAHMHKMAVEDLASDAEADAEVAKDPPEA